MLYGLLIRIFVGLRSGSTLISLIGLTTLSFMGCTRVMPYERGDLGRRCMQSPYSQMELRLDYENKIQQTATAAELPGGTPGGGCGCTQ